MTEFLLKAPLTPNEPTHCTNVDLRQFSDVAGDNILKTSGNKILWPWPRNGIALALKVAGLGINTAVL